MQALLPWIADALVLLGLATMTLGVYGMFWMPDIYTRLHAAGKSVFLGVMPALLAACLSGELAIIWRAILIAAFLFLTTPVASHAIGRAAYLRREPMQRQDALDESGRLQTEARGDR
jgi:multicomponent Na+:H+ antiporter subunit G